MRLKVETKWKCVLICRKDHLLYNYKRDVCNIYFLYFLSTKSNACSVDRMKMSYYVIDKLQFLFHLYSTQEERIYKIIF